MEIFPCPSSPKLVKTMSTVEAESVVENVINELIQSVVDEIEPIPKIKKIKKDLRYVKIQEAQSFITVLRNFIFYILVQLNLIFYTRTYDVEVVDVDNNNNIKYYQEKLICYDNFFTIGHLKIEYEYLKIFNHNANCVFLKFITGKSLVITSKKSKEIFDVISQNMNYHIRYNKIDLNISNYIKLKDDITVY